MPWQALRSVHAAEPRQGVARARTRTFWQSRRAARPASAPCRLPPDPLSRHAQAVQALRSRPTPRPSTTPPFGCGKGPPGRRPRGEARRDTSPGARNGFSGGADSPSAIRVFTCTAQAASRADSAHETRKPAAQRNRAASRPQLCRALVPARGDGAAVGADGDGIDPTGVARERGDAPAGRGVPHPHRPVAGARDERGAVRAEGHSVHRAGVASEGGEVSASGGLPEGDRAAVEARSEGGAIGAEGDRQGGLPVAWVESRDAPAVGDGPEHERRVEGARGEGIAARAEGQGTDIAAVPCEDSDALAGSDRPKHDCCVFRASRECGAVWAKCDAVYIAAVTFEGGDACVRGQVPKFCRLVPGPCAKDGTFGTERNGRHDLLVTLEGGNALMRGE